MSDCFGSGQNKEINGRDHKWRVGFVTDTRLDITDPCKHLEGHSIHKVDFEGGL
jgi:hypothetical protein